MRYNYANQNSVIAALKTSTTTPFVIKSCEFSHNSGGSNTLSFKEANGLIDSSTFANNYAKSSSENIFMSFSTIQI